jgi:hypothetical protein
LIDIDEVRCSPSATAIDRIASSLPRATSACASPAPIAPGEDTFTFPDLAGGATRCTAARPLAEPPSRASHVARSGANHTGRRRHRLKAPRICVCHYTSLTYNQEAVFSFIEENIPSHLLAKIRKEIDDGD